MSDSQTQCHSIHWFKVKLKVGSLSCRPQGTKTHHHPTVYSPSSGILSTKSSGSLKSPSTSDISSRLSILSIYFPGLPAFSPTVMLNFLPVTWGQETPMRLREVFVAVMRRQRLTSFVHCFSPSTYLVVVRTEVCQKCTITVITGKVQPISSLQH